MASGVAPSVLSQAESDSGTSLLGLGLGTGSPAGFEAGEEMVGRGSLLWKQSLFQEQINYLKFRSFPSAHSSSLAPYHSQAEIHTAARLSLMMPGTEEASSKF